MDKPEFVLEIEIHKILKDFKRQTDHLILIKTSDLQLINKKKKNLSPSTFCCADGPYSKNQRIDKYIELARALKKWFHMKVTVELFVVVLYIDL